MTDTKEPVPLLTAYHAEALVLHLGDADREIGAALRALASGAAVVVPASTAEPVAVCPCTCLKPCAQDCHCYDPFQDGCCQRCDGSGVVYAPPATQGGKP